MTKEQKGMISLLNGSSENFTREIYDYVIELLKNQGIENKEKFLIYLIEYQDSNFINALYIKAIELLQQKK